MQRANNNIINGNEQLIETLSNLRQGDAVILDFDHLLKNKNEVNKELPQLFQYLQETGHPIILLTAQPLDATNAQLRQLNIKNDTHTLLHHSQNKGEILGDYIRNHLNEFKAIKRLHIINENADFLENDTLNKFEKIHYDYQPQSQAIDNNLKKPLSANEEDILISNIVKTQLQKGKVLDDVKQKRHSLLSKDQSGNVQEVRQENKNIFSQTEFHLKSVMGNEFNNQMPIETNIRKFLESDKYKDYSSSGGDEYIAKADVNYSPAVINKLIPQAVNMIEYEKSHPEMVFFYHGASSQVAYAYQIYTALYKILAADSTVDALRTDNALFHRHLNIQSFIAHFQSLSEDKKIDDHNPNYVEAAISTNVFLFGNHDIQGSNTINYYANNKSVSSNNLKNMLEASLKSMGVSDSKINQLSQLFNEFPTRDQGSLYQIGLPKDEVDRYSYLAGVVGVLNPLPKTLGGTTDVSRLYSAMHNSEAIPSDYVKNVQARVMLSPDAHISINQYHLNPIHSDKQAKFDEQLNKIAMDMARDILLNQSQFNKLNSKSALMRYLPNVMQQAGVDIGRHKKNITDDTLIHLIEAGDLESVKKIVIANPEYKEKLLVSSKKAYTSYANHNKTDENAPRSLLERCLAIRYSGENIRAIFGDQFYEGKLNTLVFHQVVGAIAEHKRLAFIMEHKDRIQEINSLALVIDTLNKHDQAKLIETFQDKIQNASHVTSILSVLSEEMRFDFAKKYASKIQNVADLVMVVSKLPEDVQLNFVMANLNKVHSGFDLGKIINILPEQARLDFAIANKNKIQWSFEIAAIIESLPQNSRLNFAMENNKIILNAFDLDTVLRSLPQESRFDFAMANRDKIGSAFFNVLPLLHPDHQIEFVIKNTDKIPNYSQLVDTLNKLPMPRSGDNLTLAIRNENIDLVKVLLNHKAVDINQANKDGILPIGVAMQKNQETGNDEIVKALLNHKDINLKASDKNHAAIDYLDETSKNYYKSQPLVQFLDEVTKKLEGKGQDGLIDNLEMDQRDLDDDIMYKDEHQLDLDAYCERIESSFNYFKASQVLAQPGYDVFQELNKVKNEMANRQIILRGKDLLSKAIVEGRLDTVKKLLKESAIDVNLNNPLALAIKANHLDIVKTLLNEPKINVNQLDSNHIAPIGLAMENKQETGNDEIVKALLNHKEINLKASDKNHAAIDYLDETSKNYYKSQPLVHFLDEVTKKLEGKDQDGLIDNLEMDQRDLDDDIMYKDEHQLDLDAYCERIESSFNYFKAPDTLSKIGYDVTQALNKAKNEMMNREAILRGQPKPTNTSTATQVDQSKIEMRPDGHTLIHRDLQVIHDPSPRVHPAVPKSETPEQNNSPRPNKK